MKEKSIGAEPINIYTTHKIEREFYYRNFQSGFFRLNVELNTKTKMNDEIKLFYFLFSSLWSGVYIHRKIFTEFHLRKTQMLINIGHKIGDVDKYSR